MIELLHFSKKYRHQKVLDIDNWTFETGLYLLKGVNGSGKSTLLQSLAALIPFKGQIKVSGVNVHQNPRFCREKVSFSPAEPLYPEFLAGTELLGFFKKCKGGAPWKLDTLLEGFAAGSFLDNTTGTYSSGMLKKLSLLLAFTGNPLWILLDEPYNGLDALSAAALSVFIENLHYDYEVSFIISSHQSHHELGKGIQKTILLEKGKISAL